MDIKDKINSAMMQSDPSANLKARFAGKPGKSGQWLSEEKDKKLQESCRDFESVFLNMMLQSMRKTLPGDALLGKSLASDIFQSMFDQNLATQISKNGEGLGVSGMAYRDLKAKITGVHEAPVKPHSRFYRDEPVSVEPSVSTSETDAQNQEKTDHNEEKDALSAELFRDV